MNPGSLVPVSVFLTTVLCCVHSAVFSKVIIESLALENDSCNLGWFGCTPVEKRRHYVQVLPSPTHTPKVPSNLCFWHFLYTFSERAWIKLILRYNTGSRPKLWLIRCFYFLDDAHRDWAQGGLSVGALQRPGLGGQRSHSTGGRSTGLETKNCEVQFGKSPADASGEIQRGPGKMWLCIDRCADVWLQ